MFSAILPTSDIRQGMSKANFTTLTMLACIRVSATNLVEPSGKGSSYHRRGV
jgi:hypothetical protein